MINIKYDLNTIQDKRETIKRLLYERSDCIKSENFSSISDKDLYILFELYDMIFLDGWFKNNFSGKIKLKLSRQLTRAAGNTRTQKNIGQLKKDEMEFEIKISLNHLDDFDKTERDKYVGGIKVEKKIDSLLLVLEHELCHVIEFITCGRSSCSKKPFKEMVYDIFGQEETTHKLVSHKEIVYEKYGFRQGDCVAFEYKGKRMNGKINSINKNAIVMCPNLFGRYVDKSGTRYSKFSVPINYLSHK
jgi:hypothetical protein